MLSKAKIKDSLEQIERLARVEWSKRTRLSEGEQDLVKKCFEDITNSGMNALTKNRPIFDNFYVQRFRELVDIVRPITAVPTDTFVNFLSYSQSFLTVKNSVENKVVSLPLFLSILSVHQPTPSTFVQFESICKNLLQTLPERNVAVRLTVFEFLLQLCKVDSFPMRKTVLLYSALYKTKSLFAEYTEMETNEQFICLAFSTEMVVKAHFQLIDSETTLRLIAEIDLCFAHSLKKRSRLKHPLFLESFVRFYFFVLVRTALGSNLQGLDIVFLSTVLLDSLQKKKLAKQIIEIIVSFPEKNKIDSALFRFIREKKFDLDFALKNTLLIEFCFLEVHKFAEQCVFEDSRVLENNLFAENLATVVLLCKTNNLFTSVTFLPTLLTSNVFLALLVLRKLPNKEEFICKQLSAISLCVPRGLLNLFSFYLLYKVSVSMLHCSVNKIKVVQKLILTKCLLWARFMFKPSFLKRVFVLFVEAEKGRISRKFLVKVFKVFKGKKVKYNKKVVCDFFRKNESLYKIVKRRRVSSVFKRFYEKRMDIPNKKEPAEKVELPIDWEKLKKQELNKTHLIVFGEWLKTEMETKKIAKLVLCNFPVAFCMDRKKALLLKAAENKQTVFYLLKNVSILEEKVNISLQDIFDKFFLFPFEPSFRQIFVLFLNKMLGEYKEGKALYKLMVREVIDGLKSGRVENVEFVSNLFGNNIDVPERTQLKLLRELLLVSVSVKKLRLATVLILQKKELFVEKIVDYVQLVSVASSEFVSEVTKLFKEKSVRMYFES